MPFAIISRYKVEIAVIFCKSICNNEIAFATDNGRTQRFTKIHKNYKILRSYSGHLCFLLICVIEWSFPWWLTTTERSNVRSRDVVNDGNDDDNDDDDDNVRGKRLRRAAESLSMVSGSRWFVLSHSYPSIRSREKERAIRLCLLGLKVARVIVVMVRSVSALP